jgi:hypothetical protein
MVSLGLKYPCPFVDQTPCGVPPEIVPLFMATVELFVQTFISGGTKTVGGSVKLMITVSVVLVHPPREDNTRLTVPVVASDKEGVYVVFAEPVAPYVPPPPLQFCPPGESVTVPVNATGVRLFLHLVTVVGDAVTFAPCLI